MALGDVLVDNVIVLGVFVGTFGLLMIGVRALDRRLERYSWRRAVQAAEEARERYYTGRPPITR